MKRYIFVLLTVVVIIPNVLVGMIYAATLNGGEGNDRLIGTNSADTINGRGGNDSIEGRGGADTIYGGAGRDTIYGGDGDDCIRGDEFSNYWNCIYVNGYFDTIVSNQQEKSSAEVTLTPILTDSLLSTSTPIVSTSTPIVSTSTPTVSTSTPTPYIDIENSDTIYGGPGNDDIVDLSGSNNIIYGEDGNDKILINAKLGSVDAGSGNDRVEGFAASVRLGSGDDIYLFEEACFRISFSSCFSGEGTALKPSLIDGGDGYDQLVLHAININNRTWTAMDMLGVVNVEYINGVNMTVTNTNIPPVGKLILVGTKGHTILDKHIIEGKIDASAVTAGVIVCTARECYGGSGGDTFTGGVDSDIFQGNGGNDSIDGGDGRDIAIFSGNAADYNVAELAYNTFTVTDLRVGSPDGVDTIVDVNVLRFADGDQDVNIAGLEIIGDDSNEVLSGGSNADRIDGAGGNDTIEGAGGNDTLLGGQGNDVLMAGVGNDTFDGGAGVDTYTTNATLPVTVNLLSRLATGVDIGTDTIGNTENVVGGSANDTLIGDAAINNLSGGGGDDVLDGGIGRDMMTGGTGKDRFIYKGLSDSRTGVTRRDVIRDFNGGAGDRINLSAIDAYIGRPGNQAFVYIGANPFSGKRGEVRFINGLLQINTGRDVVADMEIMLTGVRTFNARFIIP